MGRSSIRVNARSRSREEAGGESLALAFVPLLSAVDVRLGEWPNDEPAGHRGSMTASNLLRSRSWTTSQVSPVFGLASRSLSRSSMISPCQSGTGSSRASPRFGPRRLQISIFSSTERSSNPGGGSGRGLAMMDRQSRQYSADSASAPRTQTLDRAVPLTPSVDGWSVDRPVAHSFPSQPVHVTAFELGLKIFKVLAHLRQLGRINERPELRSNDVQFDFPRPS